MNNLSFVQHLSFVKVIKIGIKSILYTALHTPNNFLKIIRVKT